jgi:hypothetical protein
MAIAWPQLIKGIELRESNMTLLIKKKAEQTSVWGT